MLKRIIAVFVIFVITGICWQYLGSSIEQLTSQEDRDMRSRVAGLWGGPQIQSAPKITQRAITVVAPEEENRIANRIREILNKKELNSGETEELRDLKAQQAEITDVAKNGLAFRGVLASEEALALGGSDVTVDLEYEPRQKGLFWYPTYKAAFKADYMLANAGAKPVLVNFIFPFSSSSNIDIVDLAVGGVSVHTFDVVTRQGTELQYGLFLKPGETTAITLKYNLKGMGSWLYVSHAEDREARNFRLTMHTNFEAIDFPSGSQSPVLKKRTGSGWTLGWEYSHLVSGLEVGMAFPEIPHPDYLVSRITYYAPVALFLYFFLLFLFTTLKELRFHPVNYFFIGCAFFAYHLLLVYLVDWVSLHIAFWIASAVSIFLVTTYMRLVVGLRYAFIEALISQLVCLVFFSYSFFFEGMTGLTITIMCILMLFIAMQVTGRIDWQELFGNDKQRHDSIKSKPVLEATAAPTSSEPKPGI